MHESINYISPYYIDLNRYLYFIAYLFYYQSILMFQPLTNPFFLLIIYFNVKIFKRKRFICECYVYLSFLIVLLLRLYSLLMIISLYKYWFTIRCGFEKLIIEFKLPLKYFLIFVGLVLANNQIKTLLFDCFINL